MTCSRCENVKMIDQYGQPVPPLSLLPLYDGLVDAEIKRVVNATWYDVLISQDPDSEPTTYLMAPTKDIAVLQYGVLWDGKVNEDLGGEIIEILRINDVLKRWSEEDGFYHA